MQALQDNAEDRFADREDAPFLDPSQPKNERPSRKEKNASREKLRIRLMITLYAIILLVEMGNAMTNGPFTRIFESIVCKNWYREHDPSKLGSDGEVPEDQCKSSAIQGEVATIKGVMEFFDGITSVLLAIPYGLLADRIGRKPTIMLSIPGFILNMVVSGVVLWWSDIFPLRAIWFSALTWLFGGGLVVASALVWTMMADVTTEQQRSAMFFQFGVVVMGSEFLSNSLGSWLMLFSPWRPLLIGWGIIIIGLCLGLTLPETKNAFSSAISEPDYSEHEMSDLSTVVDEEEQEGILPFAKATGAAHQPPSSAWMKIKTSFLAYTFFFQDRQVVLLSSAFLVYKLSRGTAWFLIQYVSIRYGWSLAAANMITSLKSILMVFLFVAILPLASWYLQKKRGADGRTKDMILTKGTLGMGLSPHIAIMIFFLVIQTMGAGFVYTTRSVVTTMIHRDQTARLYTLIEIIQALGMILASPIMTGFFNLGLQLDGFWIGLAWMVAAGLFGIVGLIIWRVRLPAHTTRSDD
ncbi:MFS transporter, putative [Talaromyces stipitatus ATCC 10500]|uniref:MFS transporter, putative n=1 Tax=Talaromyces stipitatus (strain ATCC 10500 / CBS 375.48 / QM 6759 / NRRL 1006) TaxID=441959 RepID=B8M7W3_TALSN|nr:MFS transporter, putative [Talaromyces stipitatus ATCC 10500]EED19842.1 MFS transporter, putative [Talaromyces stipitatus ATCC 10500]